MAVNRLKIEKERRTVNLTSFIFRIKIAIFAYFSIVNEICTCL